MPDVKAVQRLNDVINKEIRDKNDRDKPNDHIPYAVFRDILFISLALFIVQLHPSGNINIFAPC